RHVNRVARETLGGIEFEAAVHAQHIDRADLRNHVCGDHHHDLVEPVLGAYRLSHDFAKPAEQYARTAQRATHGPCSCPGAAPPSFTGIALARETEPAPRLEAVPV